jgi:hypothetical protein
VKDASKPAVAASENHRRMSAPFSCHLTCRINRAK